MAARYRSLHGRFESFLSHSYKHLLEQAYIQWPGMPGTDLLHLAINGMAWAGGSSFSLWCEWLDGSYLIIWPVAAVWCCGDPQIW